MINSILVTALLIGAGPDRTLVDRIVAIVDDEIITHSELLAAAQPFMEQNNTPAKKQRLCKDVLERLIAEQLVSGQVKAAKLSVSDDEAERAMKDILRNNNITIKDLEQVVTARGMTMRDYKEDLKSQLLRLKIVDLKVRARVVVPESEIESEFKKQTKDEVAVKMVKLRHIFFNYGDNKSADAKRVAMGRAKAALKRMEGGEDFAAVAKDVSDGPTASKGGDLGQMAETELLPELAGPVVKLETGKNSAPIETPAGIHVVRVDERFDKQPTTYASVRDKIYAELYSKEVERQMKVWVDELRAQSAVKIKLNDDC